MIGIHGGVKCHDVFHDVRDIFQVEDEVKALGTSAGFFCLLYEAVNVFEEDGFVGREEVAHREALEVSHCGLVFGLSVRMDVFCIVVLHLLLALLTGKFLRREACQ